MTFVKKLTCT